MKLSRLTQQLSGLFLLVLIHSITTGSFDGRNDNTSCKECHGNGNSGTLTLTGLPVQATPNTLYSGEICINDPINLNGNAGFRLHISQGTYSNLGEVVRTGGNGIDLGLTHEMPKDIINGLVCWNFDWTSPSSGNANLQLYGNAANADGNNNIQDQGGYQLFGIIPVVESCINDLTIIDNPIPSGTYQASNSITAATSTGENSSVEFDVANCIDLESGFEVPLGADFETLIGAGQGCGTLQAKVNVFYDKKN